MPHAECVKLAEGFGVHGRPSHYDRAVVYTNVDKPDHGGGRDMATMTVRVRPHTYQVLQDIARKHHESLPDTLERIVEDARRAQMFQEAGRAYAALVADPEAYAEWRAELAAWDVTLGDGLESESFEES
jgi:predicted transcriptional regulator